MRHLTYFLLYEKKKVSKEETSCFLPASEFILFFAKRRNIVLFLFERKRTKKKQQASYRLITLHLFDTWNDSSARKSLLARTRRAPSRLETSGRISCRSAKIHLVRTILMFALLSLRRGSAVACAKAQTRVGKANGQESSFAQNKKR